MDRKSGLSHDGLVGHVLWIDEVGALAVDGGSNAQEHSASDDAYDLESAEFSPGGNRLYIELEPVGGWFAAQLHRREYTIERADLN